MTLYNIANVTCRTDGCGNNGITLSIYHRPGGAVFCGVCGQQITEVNKTGEVELDE